MFKNEARHAAEWVNHHREEGVTDFLLLDNGSTDNTSQVLTELGCRVVPYPEKHSQEKAFNEYGAAPADWEAQAKRWIDSDWIMIIDFDEYVYSKNGYETITDYLSGLSDHIDGVRLQWKLFGSSGHVCEPTSVINSFTERAALSTELQPPKRWNYKTIYRNRSMGMRRKIYVHAPEPLGQTIYPIPYDKDLPTKAFVSGGRMECPKHKNFTTEKHFLELNHYATGSIEDYMSVRSRKGDVNVAAWESGFRDYKYFKQLDFNDITDTELKDKRNKAKPWHVTQTTITPIIHNTPADHIVDNETIICYWDKGFAAMPEALQRIYFHNLSVCSEHNVNLVLITDSNVDQYIDKCELFDKLKPNHKSDYVRWKFLNKHGGCWIDCDIILLDDITRMPEHDLVVFPELSLTTPQYNNMRSNGADTREILSSKDTPKLLRGAVEYCKPGCCVLKAVKESMPLRWCERKMITTIEKALKHTDALDTDGTISYTVMPWHVLGPLVCANSLELFAHKCHIMNRGAEDSNGFNAVTWKVDKSEGGYNEANLPGFNKKQWYMETAEAAEDRAKQIVSNPNAWVLPIWSIYRESDLENPSEVVFKDDRSIYKHIFKQC